jgi:hypothetical protein
LAEAAEADAREKESDAVWTLKGEWTLKGKWTLKGVWTLKGE